jgi:hypothetical protein
LFLDELNACSHEVQKAFYSLIQDRKIGDYALPKGSIVIGAGNRAQDSAIVKPMSSALMNRLIHVHLQASHRDWLDWAGKNNIHPWVMEYVQNRPDHLWSQPPKTEQAFSSPRSWHMLSDALHEMQEEVSDTMIEILSFGTLSPHHAGQFKGFIKQIRNNYALSAILKGQMKWPEKPEDRDVLYFLAQSFKAHLIKELPGSKVENSSHIKDLAHRSKALIKQLTSISLEMAQMVVASEKNDDSLPDWFMVEIARDLPRIIVK